MWKQHYSIIKELNHFSTPLVFNQLSHGLTAIIFARMIGHISMDALIITNIVDLLIYSILGILGSGTLSFNIHSSKIKKSDKALFNDFFRSIIELNLALGVLSMLLFWITSPFMLTYIFHLSGNILSQAKWYAFIVSFQLIFSMLIFVFSNQLKVYKKTKTILFIGIGSSIFHLISAYYFAYFLFDSNHALLGLALSSTLTTVIIFFSHVFVIRQDLRLLPHIRSTKKLFLLFKSIPLFFQELIEGTFLNILIMSSLSQFDPLLYSSYVLCKYLTDIALIPMFMYCNALIILIGERISQRDVKYLSLLPKLTSLIILTIFVMFMLNVALFQTNLFHFFSNDSTLIKKASIYLLLICLVESTRPLYEVNKYSLQVLGFERLTLTITILTSLVLASIFFLFSVTSILSFTSTLYLVGIFNLISGKIFSVYYQHKLNHLVL